MFFISNISKRLKITIIILFVLCLCLAVVFWLQKENRLPEIAILSSVPKKTQSPAPFVPEPQPVEPTTTSAVQQPRHPMDIELLRSQQYLGSELVIEQALTSTASAKQYIASYKSEGLKIYGLLTVPTAPKPASGFPAIIFIHGYIPPKQYSTIENYTSYQAVLTRNGFVTFKPDLRGHGKSEGQAVGAHFSEKYVVDTLNALASLKMHKDVDPNRMGYWGHSNGGEIGLRSLVITQDIKAASLWAGVVGSFEDMLETYNNKIPFLKDTQNSLVVENGLPSANPEFWQRIDPYFFLNYISAPVQLHHGTADASVPVELSARLKEELEKAGKSVEYYEYPGDDHNIIKNFGLAWKRTVEFFKKNL